MSSSSSLKDWSQDDVGRWLSSINFGYMVTKFEMLNVDGPLLASMDEAYIDSHFRMNPGERITFTAALQGLRSSSINNNQQYVSGSRSPLTMSANNTYHSPQTRGNTFSGGGYGSVEHSRPRFDSDSMKRVVKVQHKGPQNEPELKICSAPELSRECRHSGWIRKQGGSNSRCEWVWLTREEGVAMYITIVTCVY